MRLAAFLGVVLVVCVCACGARGPVRPDRSRWPVLVLQCDVPDATVWVDDRFVGQIRTMPSGMRLAPGRHRLELRHDRYHTRYVEVTLVSGERRTLQVSLPEAFP